MKLVNETYKKEPIVYNIDADILNTMIEGESPNILLNHILLQTDLLDFIKNISNSFHISSLEDGKNARDDYPVIFIDLSQFYNIEQNYNYTTMIDQLMKEFKTLKFSNLNLNEWAANDKTTYFFDEFTPTFNLNNLDNNIQQIVLDLKKVNEVLKSFSIELPKNLALKKIK